MLDDGARHDIAGIVVGIVGVATLIAVLTPTSGVLTQAVSDGLHAVLGVGAFLLPLALLLWALTFFVRIPYIEPGRVAAGLGLVALAVMGIVGLCTPNIELDPSLLFNAYVLADRGGYVGNGIAWALLTLTGRVVGLVVLAGVAIAGVVVIGFNAGEALRNVAARYRQRRAYGHARSEERAAKAARSQSAAWMRQGRGVPADYAPTALFDPERPLSQGAPTGRIPYGAATTYLDADGVPRPRTASVIRPDDAFQEAAPVALPKYFGCGNSPHGMDEQEYAALATPVPEPRRASEPQPPSGRQPVPTTFITADMLDVETLGDAPSAKGVPQGVSEVDEAPAETSAPVETRPPSRRLRQASRWWDPADDWNREDFDPRQRTGGAPSTFVPGVLPGAPVSIEAEEAADSEVPCLRGNIAAPPASTPIPDRLHSDVANRVSALTAAAVQANAVQAASVPQRQSAHKARPATPSKVELPWEEPLAVPCAGEVVEHGDHAFVLPNPAIFKKSGSGLEKTPEQHREAAETAGLLQAALNEFGVKAEVVDWVVGPSCTTYQVRPGEGVRVNRFTALEDDIARVLARTSVRVYAPVPGTSFVGIEVSNNSRQPIMFGDVLSCLDGGPLDFALGLDTSGRPVHADLAKLPHLLVAGTTGSGKSVCMNTIIMSLLVRNTPDDVRLIMVDPKQVEFANYNGTPHLIMPVVTDMRQAAAALQWGVTEMDRRYRVFSNLGVRDLKSYNAQVDAGTFENTEFPLQHLPSVVFFIDELADLMMVAKKDVEASIVRIAQLGRACGIHLVIATQTPRADIVTGLIRANVANRIALRVSKSMDSKIILDQTGAEKLLPHGDMLFLEAGFGDRPRRIQGCYLSDDEIARVVDHLKEQGGSEYNSQMAPLPGTQLTVDLSGGTEGCAPGMAAPGASGGSSEDDPLAWEAAQLVVENQLGSTSMIQRRLKLGYARAGRVMDMLEEMGVVGPARGSKPRDVLIRDLEELATLRGGFDGSEEDF